MHNLLLNWHTQKEELNQTSNSILRRFDRICLSNSSQNFAITIYKCPMDTHKRSQQVISTPYDFRLHEKTGEIFRVVFTGVNFW